MERIWVTLKLKATLTLCLIYGDSLYLMSTTSQTSTNDIISSLFRLDHFDGLIPFDFKTEPADSNSKYLGEQTLSSQHDQ